VKTAVPCTGDNEGDALSRREVSGYGGQCAVFRDLKKLRGRSALQYPKSLGTDFAAEELNSIYQREATVHGKSDAAEI